MFAKNIKEQKWLEDGCRLNADFGNNLGIILENCFKYKATIDIIEEPEFLSYPIKFDLINFFWFLNNSNGCENSLWTIKLFDFNTSLCSPIILSH